MDNAVKQNRDRANGQFTYEGDFERRCVCGHNLGDHTDAKVAGEQPCIAETEEGCECMCFKPERKPAGALRGFVIYSDGSGAAATYRIYGFAFSCVWNGENEPRITELTGRECHTAAARGKRSTGFGKALKAFQAAIDAARAAGRYTR